jgi:hypothetical protein
MKGRKPIPRETQLQLLIQCGYKCSMPKCSTTESLVFHHINKKPDDNRRENIIVLCAVHAHLADTGRITAKACKRLKQMLQKTEDFSKTWKPLPNIDIYVTQRLRHGTLALPAVGWEAYNNSPYQLKVRFEVHPIFKGRDLFPLSYDKDICGKRAFPTEPMRPIFLNGHFSLPPECATSKEDELILEIRAAVEDVNSPQKGIHKLLPRRWKYVREFNEWSYYPQQPIA